MNKKIISIIMAMVLIFNWTPINASASDSENVYISISTDGQYNLDANSNPIAYVEVSMDALSAIDLTEYGLSDYLYDSDGDGAYEITALHLYIYTHEEICGGDWSEVSVSGSAGSIFFETGLFGYTDCNLQYFLNGAYPAVDGWGVTADQIVLSAGDFMDIASYTSWSFYSDSATGFHYFADSNNNITHSYSAETETAATIKLVRAYSDMFSGGNAIAEEAGYTISYGTTVGNATGTVTTDDSGCADITFPTAGNWYVWCDGGYGTENPMDIVSTPAYAKVTVTESVDPDEVAAEAVISKIKSIGTVTIESENIITEAREAYDALTDAQKELVSNYETLTTAETTLAQLKEAEEEPKEDPEEDPEPAVTVDTNPKAIYEATYTYMSDLGTPTVGSTGGEWMVIDLTRGGYECPDGYYDNVVSYVNENINANEQLHRAKSTDNSRVILALTSAGYDVTDVDGHNLLMGLTDMAYVKKQGINGPIWALIAFDSHDYEIPTNSSATEQVTRDKLISYILEKQLDDGGWTLSGTSADVDMTSMAIQALSPYYNTNAEVKTAVDEAITLLSGLQHDDGGFGSIDGACSESCAQVIVALTSLGINPENDSRFVKNGASVVDALCGFAVDGGGFAHIPGGAINGMSTEQSQYALVAYFRFLDNKKSLYDMRDVTINKNELDSEEESGGSEGEITPGVIENTTDESENDCSATLDIADTDLADKLLTDEEKAMLENGADINISLSVEDISTTVSDEDKKLIDSKLGTNKVGLYLDITLSKKIGDNSPVAIKETNGEITITITIPENLRNTASDAVRAYKIIRVHDSEVEIIDADYDATTGKLSFRTDAFSTYALVYSDITTDVDVDETTETTDVKATPESDSPKTGDSSNIAFLVIIMLMSVAGMTVMTFEKKRG